ncbi:acVLRF1 family peptidyl-tRNA hydrolase [Nocardioides sambongensis]|uniref:acVLRF1 family peptidyl-tRNA hydrolase n=1 Tax=Nocardioides sambongensis TaxID=2589074 RepID=UPI0011288915|nr:acVLRF1 family peptidyl-tRNA hydrolase [Nocardioides sambongensis]
MSEEAVRTVRVPTSRWERWVAGFAERHGSIDLGVEDGVLVGHGGDGSWFRAALPFARRYDAGPVASGLVDAAQPPAGWGVLLVRKGGFAVARLEGGTMVDSKVGQRHVQGRTKAGGQSQQRFARRRENQARGAYQAAADHAARILAADPHAMPEVVITGGDGVALREVLADPRLAGLEVADLGVAVVDPRRRVLEQAVVDACALSVTVQNRTSSAP